MIDSQALKLQYVCTWVYTCRCTMAAAVHDQARPCESAIKGFTATNLPIYLKKALA